MGRKRKFFMFALLAAAAGMLTKLVRGRRAEHQASTGWDAPPAPPPAGE